MRMSKEMGKIGKEKENKQDKDLVILVFKITLNQNWKKAKELIN